MAAGLRASIAPTASLSGPPAASAEGAPAPFTARPIPAELLVPLIHCPSQLQAPSAEDWLTSPVQVAYLSQGYAVWRQDSLESGAMAAPAERSAPVVPSAAEGRRASVSARMPLPPKRPVQLASLSVDDTSAQPTDESAMPETDDEAAAAGAPLPPARPIPPSPRRVTASQAPAEIEALIVRHAERFEVPQSLVRRVAWRESKFDPKQRNGPYWGLMQIRVDTARSLGFRGKPADLLDADTNMTYAVAYLANAYRVAGRNESRAVALYAKGYYYEAKRKRMLGALITTASVAE